MARAFDLIIRDGTVVDGTGGEPREGDVAVLDDRIAAVGRVAGTGREEIDARGLLVTPGFVDIHTHYDGQATWDARLAPSSWHGVTSVVMGNCGVGFAPCRPEDRETLVRLMEGVEDIPGTALHEGLAWNWESFAEYLDAIDARPHDVDVAAMAPHGPLRVYAMGDRAVRREAATEADTAHMATLAADAVRAGALGLSTSRTVIHRTADGEATPMYGAAAGELVEIARGARAAGARVFQMVSDFVELDEEFAVLRDVARETGLAASFTLTQNDFAPHQWRALLERIDKAQTEGLAIRGQVLPRPIGLVMGLEASIHPFLLHPAYREIESLPLAERAARLRDPAFRARLLAEEPEGFHPFIALFGRRFDRYFPMGDPPDYEPPAEASVAAEAVRTGRAPEDVLLDRLAAEDGKALLYFTFTNYAAGNLDAAREMMVHPHTLFGLGDGGAHVGTIADASATTTALAHWGRDRRRGRLPLPWLVRFLTRAPAEAVGLADRGLLAPGMKADLNVIDFARLRARRPEIRWDLPAGGRRFVQRAEGYVATVVSGRVTYREGEATGALPGRLARGPRCA